MQPGNYYKRLGLGLSNSYELIDSAFKFYTMLLEVRKLKYEGKLKIEIRKNKKRLNSIIMNFSSRDYKVKLGSLLEKDLRKYYIENNFSYLLGIL